MKSNTCLWREARTGRQRSRRSRRRRAKSHRAVATVPALPDAFVSRRSGLSRGVVDRTGRTWLPSTPRTLAIRRAVGRGRHPLQGGRRSFTPNHMVQCSSASFDVSFAALADATRRGVLDQLSRGDASITDLADRFEMSLTGMKKHVGALELAGLVTTEKIGRVRTCRIGPCRLRRKWSGSRVTARCGARVLKRSTMSSMNSDDRGRPMVARGENETRRTMVQRKSDREVVVTRTFDAPARLVFEAWSRAELFKKWWVPRSMGMTLHCDEAGPCARHRPGLSICSM